MIDELREKANKLPLLPGVYLMHDEEGTVIYVGKAKKLKNRVTSYFRGAHNSKTEAMVAKVRDFEVIIANSEFEALVLENSLIKRHMPYYNILLKDDKGYPFIRLDVHDKYPRFTLASEKKADGARYFGPFGGRSMTFDAIDAICKTLGLPTCSKVFPRDIGKERPCLNHHLGVCAAWCRGEPGEEEYRRVIDEAVLILDGRTSELTAKLEEDMNAAAGELRFELAAEKRDKLRAVEKLRIKQHVITGLDSDTDVIGFYRGAVKSCFTVLHFSEGSLAGKDFELMDAPLEDDEEAVSYMTMQYYERRRSYPREVCLPFESEDADLLERMFSEKAGRKVSVTTPKRGEKRKLTETAQLNAKQEVERATDREEKALKTMEWLKNALKMEKEPYRIEAYDISNTGSSDIVASMTVFERGRPLKRAYKKFKIKGTDTPDDYYSMYETLSRRFERYLKGDESFGVLPDLLLIDGGAVHAGVAEAVLNEKGLAIPVYGMVKDDRHRTRALISAGGEEVGISANPAVFSFIGRIQEETHRFAVAYHHELRSKSLRASALDGIAGIGEKRKSELLKKFKTLKAISAASVAELQAAIPKNAAAAVYRYFHEGADEK